MSRAPPVNLLLRNQVSVSVFCSMTNLPFLYALEIFCRSWISLRRLQVAYRRQTAEFFSFEHVCCGLRLTRALVQG